VFRYESVNVFYNPRRIRSPSDRNSQKYGLRVSFRPEQSEVWSGVWRLASDVRRLASHLEDCFTLQMAPLDARTRIAFEPINGDEPLFPEAVNIIAHNFKIKLFHDQTLPRQVSSIPRATLCCYLSEYCFLGVGRVSRASGLRRIRYKVNCKNALSCSEVQTFNFYADPRRVGGLVGLLINT